MQALQQRLTVADRFAYLTPVISSIILMYYAMWQVELFDSLAESGPLLITGLAIRVCMLLSILFVFSTAIVVPMTLMPL